MHAWGAGFGSFRYREIQLLGMLERAFGAGAPMPRLQRLDEQLLGAVPGLRRYCRYVVLFMQRWRPGRGAPRRAATIAPATASQVNG